jgi:hypothetical protein
LHAQNSSLGVTLGNLSISGIGLADDTALLSNSIEKLFYLLELTKHFCQKYQVELCAEKTKLQIYSTKKMAFDVAYAETINSMEINGEKIGVTDLAEHVGMLRSSSGNGPTILARITAHKQALNGVLHTGMARGHKGNPAASLRVDKLYAIPVLLSGMHHWS